MFDVQAGASVERAAGWLERVAPVIVEDRAFTDVVTITYVVKCADEDAMIREIVDLTEGEATPVRFEEFYFPWSET